MSGKAGSEQWGSRWGLILSAIGMAVGTGNIWRFPRVAAANGGGVFVVALMISLFLWAIPLMMAEAVWGKKSRMGCVGSFKVLMGKKYTWLGGVVGWIVLAIVFYYAVVMGWCVRYFVYALMGTIKPGLDTEALWTAFSTTKGAMVPWHIISMIITVAIVYKGAIAGIEKANKILIPPLFVLLLVLVGRSVTLDGADKGLEFLFHSQWGERLKGKIWLEAFTQAAWSTGAGWGLMLTYFVYVGNKEDIALNATTVCLADTTAALLAGLAVIPTIFALSPDPQAAVTSGNTGLAFIHLTRLFTVMPGGTIMAIAFFLALVCAALSSMLSMIELGCRMLLDMGMERKKAILVAGVGITILGLPSSMSISFLDNQDWVWGVALLVSGLIFSLGAIKIGVQKIWDEDIEPCSDIKAAWMWKLIYLFPLWFVLIFAWWTIQAASWYPGEWYKWLPISKYTFTVGTMYYQWAICFGIIFVLNNWLAEKTKYPAKVDFD